MGPKIRTGSEYGCVSVRITSEVIKTPGLNWGYQLPGQSHLTIAPPNATPPEVTC